jgi:hypothetical protein
MNVAYDEWVRTGPPPARVCVEHKLAFEHICSSRSTGNRGQSPAQIGAAVKLYLDTLVCREMQWTTGL